MSRLLWAASLLALIAQMAIAAEEPPIDRETLDRWSAPYRGWHYWPDPILPAEPKIPGHETFRNTDVPCVYQLPGQADKWYMICCIYQPWLLEHDSEFYDFYNAAQGGVEQTGLAFSTDLLNWKRYSGNPVIHVRPKGYDERFASDPKVFRDGDHWMMFYFGVGRSGAHVMVAFSRDLLHWMAHPEPLYQTGGHPGGLDKTYAHKISLVYQPKNETFYLYYCAVGNKGRCIGLITSKRLDTDANGVPWPSPIHERG